MSLDVEMMDVLLSFDGLARWLAQDGAKFGRGLLPLRAGKAFGAHDEFAFGRDDDDQLGHVGMAFLEANADGQAAVGAKRAVHAGLEASVGDVRQLLSFRPRIAARRACRSCSERAPAGSSGT